MSYNEVQDNQTTNYDLSNIIKLKHKSLQQLYDLH